MPELKTAICDAIDRAKDELLVLSHDIHDDPELSGQEYRASGRICDFLSGKNFEITREFCGEKTAFKARLSSQKPGPVIAFIAEYDALPGLGHGCGHNIIAASAAGAAVGISEVIGRVSGEVLVIGCPDEEGAGGKIRLLRAGAFKGVDFVLEVHPSNKNLINRGHVACSEVKVEYEGKEAHSSIPSAGINALSALITLFNMVDTHRQIWPTKWAPRVNGIICEGGKASNVITPYASGKLLVRTKHVEELRSIIKDIENLAEAAGKSVGAKLKIQHGQIFEDTVQNSAIGFKFAENMRTLGVTMNLPEPDERMGSSDIGNVSHVVPTVHEYLKITDPENETGTHTKGFVQAAASPRGDEAVILGAKGMALTAYDLFTDRGLREAARGEFAASVGK
ncbi:M20 family metallopeptidase [Cloacibacillus evryensis]|uniref:M20 family metallopeptidase n=1 Tax=Cloacibacillus evryensis TaxID=508460 RepID=UPI00210EB9CC|nr:M20 family metallopeptidase [Cloacibacillus evryensis]MCQ4765311.1 M20 family metallopeptidase [Cloacibacillus evryensis]